jgi:hypothetical protein
MYQYRCFSFVELELGADGSCLACVNIARERGDTSQCLSPIKTAIYDSSTILVGSMSHKHCLLLSAESFRSPALINCQNYLVVEQLSQFYVINQLRCCLSRRPFCLLYQRCHID